MNGIAGAVTVFAAKDKLLQLESSGLADVAVKGPIAPETLFSIASIEKPITGTAVFMVHGESEFQSLGRLSRHASAAAFILAAISGFCSATFFDSFASAARS